MRDQRRRAFPTGVAKLLPLGIVPLDIDRELAVHGPPFADGVVVLQAEAERVHLASGRTRTPRWRGAFSICWRRESEVPTAASSSGGTSGGGGAGGVPRISFRMYFPRMTTEVRVA